MKGREGLGVGMGGMGERGRNGRRGRRGALGVQALLFPLITVCCKIKFAIRLNKM